MAEEKKQEVEVKDRGLFDFLGKKEDKSKEEEVLVAGVGKVRIEEEKKEEKEEEKKESLLDKLHRSHSSSSSSSSDEEEGEGENKEKKKKKKKGLVEKIKEKIGDEGEKKPAVVEQEVAVTAVSVESEDSTVKVEKVDESLKVEGAQEEEKKGFLEKIKEKLPGHKKAEEATAPAAECASHGTKEHETDHGHEGKEKKGILGKLMEKLPGYHKNGGEECDKSSATH